MIEKQGVPKGAGPKKDSVFVGAWDAVKAVPEWHRKLFMDIYKSVYYDKLSPEEKKVAAKTLPVIEKRAKALGWLATGAEALAITSVVAKGYSYFKDRNRLAVHTRNIQVPASAPIVIRDTAAVTARVTELVEAVTAPEVLYHPGTLVEVADGVTLATLIKRHEPRYEHLLRVNGNDEGIANALLLANDAFGGDAFLGDLPEWKESMSLIGKAFKHGRDNGPLKLKLAELLPHKGYPLKYDHTYYVEALRQLQDKYINNWHVWSPGVPAHVAFNWWGRLKFPETKLFLSTEKVKPIEVDAMKALGITFKKLGWMFEFK